MTCAVITAMKVREKKSMNGGESCIQGHVVTVTRKSAQKTMFLMAILIFLVRISLENSGIPYVKNNEGILIDQADLVSCFHQSYGTSHVELALDIKLVSLNCFFAYR